MYFPWYYAMHLHSHALVNTYLVPYIPQCKTAFSSATILMEMMLASDSPDDDNPMLKELLNTVKEHHVMILRNVQNRTFQDEVHYIHMQSLVESEYYYSSNSAKY